MSDSSQEHSGGRAGRCSLWRRSETGPFRTGRRPSMKQEDPTVRLEIRDFSRAEKANGDVVARARELMRDVEGYGDWILEPNEDSNGAYHVHSSSGSCIAEFSDRGDARFAANARMLVPELIEYALDEHAAADHWHVLWRQNVETASAAMRERDAANAEVEKLRGALETIKAITTASELAHKIAVDLCCGTPSPFTVVGADILAVIERAGIEP